MINFNLKFATNDKGFTPSQAQKDAMTLAARQWGSQFANDATIDLTVESESSPFPTNLMSSRSEIVQNKPAPGFGDIGIVRTKALTGKDLNGAKRDGVITVDWGNNWELDFDETPNAAENEYDFYSTFYHELSHALGFGSVAAASDPFGTFFTKPGSWTAFDQYVTDSKGNSIFNDDNSLDFSQFLSLKKGGNSQDNKGLFFSGPNAKAANGGRGVGLYTPTVGGPSTLSHLDDDNPALAKSLMAAATPPGLSAREFSDIEKGIFKDLGYSFGSDATTPPNTSPGNNDNPTPTPDPIPTPDPTAEAKPVELITLGDGNTITLNLDNVGFAGLGELLVSSADDDKGGNIKQIANFSILGGDELPNDYSPSFTVDKDKISKGKFLQFDLLEEGKAIRSATSTPLDDGKVSLDFGEGTQLSFQPDTDTAQTNLLVDDAAAIDLSQQKNKSTELSFRVYREAGYNNTVGLYETDTADGVIVLDPILGTRVRPGDAGYKEAAIDRRLDTLLTGENGQVKTFSTTVKDTSFLGTFLIADSADFSSEDIYFSHGAANKNNNDHVKLLGNNTFGFEDLAGLGDKDYNDFVVAFDVA